MAGVVEIGELIASGDPQGRTAAIALAARAPEDPAIFALTCHLYLSERRLDDLRDHLERAAARDIGWLNPFFHALVLMGSLRRMAGFLDGEGVHRTGGPLAGLLGLFHHVIHARGWSTDDPWPLDNAHMLDPVADRMPPVSHELARRISETGHGMGNPTPTAGGEIPWSDGEVLFNLVAQLRPRRILEIGFAKGLSTIFMLSAWDGIESHTVVDPLQKTAYDHNGVKNVAAAGFAEKLRLIQLPSAVAMPKLLADGETFDLIFIDGSHCFEYTILEAVYADLLAEPHTLVAYHDYHMEPVYAATEFMRLNRGWSRVIAADVAITRRDRAKLNFPEHYVPFATSRP